MVLLFDPLSSVCRAKGQQKKGQARMRRYEDLVTQASSYVKSSAVDSITIPIGPRLGDVVVEVQGLSKSFDGRLLVDDMTFSVPPGAVVGIIGGNGAGKSTLFRMIMKQDSPDKGTLRLGDTVVPMYVDQSRELLNADRTVYEEIAEGAEEVRRAVGRCAIWWPDPCPLSHPYHGGLDSPSSHGRWTSTGAKCPRGGTARGTTSRAQTSQRR